MAHRQQLPADMFDELCPSSLLDHAPASVWMDAGTSCGPSVFAVGGAGGRSSVTARMIPPPAMPAETPNARW